MSDLYMCEHPGCSDRHAEPQFTKAVLKLVKGDRQPEWFCGPHQPEHPKVTFWGKVIWPGRGVFKLGTSQGRSRRGPRRSS